MRETLPCVRIFRRGRKGWGWQTRQGLGLGACFGFQKHTHKRLLTVIIAITPKRALLLSLSGLFWCLGLFGLLPTQTAGGTGNRKNRDIQAGVNIVDFGRLCLFVCLFV